MNTPKELAKLLETPVIGNAFNDSGIFAAAHLIIMDENYSMVYRIKAIQKVDDTMGLGETCTEAEVADYVAEFPEDLIKLTK